MAMYYQEIKKLWEAGEFVDAIGCFSSFIQEGLLSQQEIEDFNKNLANFWESVEAECEKNPKVMFSLYEMIEKARNWDDETLCKELRISPNALVDIKSLRLPISDGVGLRMLYELFPQMAV